MNSTELIGLIGGLINISGAIYLLWSARAPETRFMDLKNMNRVNRIVAAVVIIGTTLQLTALIMQPI